MRKCISSKFISIWKDSSIKKRITLWYAIFLLLIVITMFGVVLTSQHMQSRDFYYEKLTTAMEQAVQSIHLENGEVVVETQTDSGVRITVLDENNKLLVGKRHFSARLKEEVLRIRENNANADWYLLDKPIQLEDGRTVWLRLYISSNLSERTSQTILYALLFMMPLLLAAILLGGYRVACYAFRPIDEITRTAASISDSSDLKQRIYLEGQTDEVSHLAETFDGMFARLERSLENEKRFISDASHELRTPLSVICTQSEYALADDRSVDEMKTALRIILEYGQRTSEMLAQLLMLSRMDYQKQPLNMEFVDLSDLMEGLALEMQTQAEERKISIVSTIQPNVKLVCDELMILRMATNLIQNSIQYGRENGHVQIVLNKIDGKVRFSVSDDGIGIAPEEQKKIWNRFYQVDKTDSRGTGLGLPIVRWIVQAHGGNIHLDSKIGKGSCFTVDFPEIANIGGHNG